ncbi:MAG: hypothetical protein FWH14_06240 [Oscillospiraceae bacterium]|nr:hypothetical protein [Oscillospiraceae bacterium]
MCNPAICGKGGNLPPVVIANCRDDRPRSSVGINTAFLYPRYAQGCVPYKA